MNLDRKTKHGFSLIEVCLAVLVIGFGLVAIFKLFPSGLRSMEDDTADTRCGLFTETVMAALRANVDTITNGTDWATPSVFTNLIVQDVFGAGADAVMGVVSPTRFPNGGDWLRYRLTVNASQHSALLEVCDGQYGVFDPPQSSASTEFYFQGM